MAHETETKVLDIDVETIASRMEELGAEKILDTRYTVDWYEFEKYKVKPPWYLRIRRRSDGPAEVTWKGRSTVLGASRTHKEIDFRVHNPDEMAELFESIELRNYAHQEKDRTSWTLKDWKFDLDRYPGIPPYLEIEGHDEDHIQEAIKLLGLLGHTTSPEGEKVLIHDQYKVDWYDMRFEV